LPFRRILTGDQAAGILPRLVSSILDKELAI